MPNLPKNLARSQGFWMCLIVLLPSILLAQNIISAVGGLVHYGEGKILINDQAIEFDPARPLHVKKDEGLRTEDGRAEIMLVPDGFLRLAPHSGFEMVSAGVDSAKVRLTAGSAIVDLKDVWDDESVSLLVGDGAVYFRKPGLYRIDAKRGEPVTVKVFKGKATVEANGSDRNVKSKQSATLSESEGIALAKFDRSKTDPLDDWSEKRDSLLAEARAQAQAQARDDRDSAYDILLKDGSPMWRCRQLGFGCGPTSPGASGPSQQPRPQPQPSPPPTQTGQGRR